MKLAETAAAETASRQNFGEAHLIECRRGKTQAALISQAKGQSTCLST